MRREQLWRSVTDAVSRSGPHLYLGGSFHHGDFHLYENMELSLSDVDLVAVGASSKERYVVADQVRSEIERHAGLSLRVSVHPEHDLSRLTSSDGRFLAIGEYLRYAVSSDPKYKNFLLAKVTLLLLRDDRSERYASVAYRLNKPEADLALQIKLGLSDEPFASSAVNLLLGSSHPEPRIFAERFLSPDTTVERIYEYAGELRLRSGISKWLRNYVASSVERAVTDVR